MTRPSHSERDVRLFLSFFLIVFFIYLQGIALASVTPAFERLAPISAQYRLLPAWLLTSKAVFM